MPQPVLVAGAPALIVSSSARSLSLPRRLWAVLRSVLRLNTPGSPGSKSTL